MLLIYRFVCITALWWQQTPLLTPFLSSLFFSFAAYLFVSCVRSAKEKVVDFLLLWQEVWPVAAVIALGGLGQCFKLVSCKCVVFIRTEREVCHSLQKIESNCTLSDWTVDTITLVCLFKSFECISLYNCLKRSCSYRTLLVRI